MLPKFESKVHPHQVTQQLQQQKTHGINQGLVSALYKVGVYLSQAFIFHTGLGLRKLAL